MCFENETKQKVPWIDVGGQSGLHGTGDDRPGLAGQNDRPARRLSLLHREQQRRRRHAGTRILLALI